MLVETTMNINDIKHHIDKNNTLEESKKNLLKNLLNIDSSFLHYSFGLGGFSSVNWDFTYTEVKTHIISSLVDLNWSFTFAGTPLIEKVFILNISFVQEQKIDDFLIGSTYEDDNRTVFNQLEIYLTEKNGRLLKGGNRR